MNLEERVNEYYHTFNDNERDICGYLLRNKAACAGMTIEEMALVCHVSESSLFRFAKKLSLTGFSDLRVRLRLETKEAPEEKTDLLSKMADSCHKMIDDIGMLDCTMLFEKLRMAERVLVFGSGYTEARVASELKRIFLPVRRKIYTMHGSEMSDALSKMAKTGDFLILISLTGESKGCIKAAQNSRMRQMETMSITRLSNNTLASLCGENLYINTIKVPLDSVSQYEISTPYFILLELLFLKYQRYLEDI